MKTLLAAAGIAAAFVVPATTAAYASDDYSRIPDSVRVEIKVKCVAEYPVDYSMQAGCIMNQSHAWLMVQGYASSPAPELTTANGVDFRNHAYLSVAAKTCALKVDTMVEDYKVRGRMMNGNVPDSTVNEYIDSYVRHFKAEMRKNRKAFCAEARGNLHNFVADISQPVAE